MPYLPNQYLDVFLASSITAFHLERLDLGNFVRGLNDILLEKGAYCRLHMCEDISDEISLTRKQDEYNDYIRESRLCFVLIGETAGAYTEEELDVALEALHATGRPQTAVFFQDGPHDPSACRLRDRLDREEPGLTTEFAHIDQVKLALLRALAPLVAGLGPVVVEEDRVLLDGRTVENIDPRQTTLPERKEPL